MPATLDALPGENKPKMAEFSSIEPQKLIEKLSHRPYEILDAMITIHTWQSPPAPSASSRPLPSRISSLGVLDRLPPEITSMILGFLDLPSLAVFARVSHGANDMIRSLRQYQDLLAFAPEAVEALRRTGVIRFHSAAHLHDALRSRRCATCIELGEFLFLPTGERCCWQCLRDHPFLRMISPREAQMYFCLSRRHLRRLTPFTVIGGEYGIFGGVYDVRQRPIREQTLFSARAAVELGLKVHGSAENLAKALKMRSLSSEAMITARFLQSGIEVPRNEDLLLMPSMDDVPEDGFFGAASMPFPSVSGPGEIHYGLWCYGCKFNAGMYMQGLLPQDVLAGIVPPNRNGKRILKGLERRARSRESFYEHIRNCYGAREYVTELERIIARDGELWEPPREMIPAGKD
ncbi:F-box domain-containing protein [Colletotrichum plurivorum]|uniref:F-box domain-containing protein n=1 Tax=Colletotrichum plurivorum TaxID=2175906 RepID=A0A8H6KVP9_9PEZI|nr:F-box domain-containing protein [Colletotrichum plurivorum]